MKNIKKYIKYIIYVVAILLGFLSIAPATMKDSNDDFNAVNAAKYLQVISKTQHSVFDYQGHEDVRQYIIKTSKELVGDENVTERNYLTENNKNPTEGITYVSNSLALTNENNINTEYDIRNVVAKIQGENDIGILLVAHYDSRGNIKRYGETANSYGAGDDGYGVVTLLEIMRYFKENESTLKNSIYFLFCDDEEVEMGGSILESKNASLMDKVNFVINVEARGLKGAAYMFETSKNNDKVIKMYKNSTNKVTYSIAPAVYTVMTNYTDFMNFTAIGKQGLNFSTLDSIEYYHCANDNYNNINLSSLQNYGSQILPIVKEYTKNEKYADMDYFNGTHDMVFYNFLPNVFITYSSTLAIIIASLLMVLAIGIIIYLILKKNFNIIKFLKALAVFVASLVLSIIIGYIFSKIVARLNGYPWSLTNVRCENFKVVFSVFSIALILLNNFAFKKLVKENNNYYLISTNLFLAVLGFIVSLKLVGASFIFMLPSLFATIYLLSDLFIKNKIANEIIMYVTMFVLVLVFVPLVYSLLLAVTIGGALALVLIGYLAYCVIKPMQNNM